MKKRLGTLLLSLSIAGVGLVIFAAPGYAFQPPADNLTDNATNVILWHGDTANITMVGLETALTNAGKIVASEVVSAFTELIMTLVVMLGLAALAYMRGDRPLFMVSGLAFMVYGFSYFSTSTYFSILMVIAGIFLFVRAFTKKGEA